MEPPDPMREPEEVDPQRRAAELVQLVEQEISLLHPSMGSHDPAVSRLTGYLDELKELIETTPFEESNGELSKLLGEAAVRAMTQISLALLERWM